MRINAALLNFIRDFIFIYAVWFINMESRDAFEDQCTKCGSNDNYDDAKKYVRAMIFCHMCERGYHFKCTGLPGSFKAWHRKRDSIFICDECEENAEWKDKEKFISSVMIAGGTESKYVKTIIEHMVKILKPSMSEPISSSNNEHDTQQVVSSISEEDPGVKYLREKFQQIMALPAAFLDCKSSIQCSMDAVMHRASKWEITLKCPFDGCDKDFTDMKGRSCLKSHYKYNHNGIEKYPIEYMRYCTTQYYCNQMMSVFKEIKNDTIIEAYQRNLQLDLVKAMKHARFFTIYNKFPEVFLTEASAYVAEVISDQKLPEDERARTLTIVQLSTEIFMKINEFTEDQVQRKISELPMIIGFVV